MFEQGQLRRAFLHEAVQDKLLWQLWAEMRMGHFPLAAEKFIAYMDGAVRRDMDRYAAELRRCPTDSLCMIKEGHFSAEEQQVFEKVCDWLNHKHPKYLTETLVTIKHNAMKRLKEQRLDNAPVQQMTALINNKLLGLIRQGDLKTFDSETYANAFEAFRNDSNLDSGNPFDVPEDMPDIEFMERLVKYLPEIPTHTVRARFAAHIMDGCIDWCYGETERKLTLRTDEVFGTARKSFEDAIAAENHPIFMAQLLLELEDTLVNTGEIDGELYDVLNAATKNVKERLEAQEHRRTMMVPEYEGQELRRTMTVPDFMTREIK